MEWPPLYQNKVDLYVTLSSSKVLCRWDYRLAKAGIDA